MSPCRLLAAALLFAATCDFASATEPQPGDPTLMGMLSEWQYPDSEVAALSERSQPQVHCVSASAL